MVSQKKIEHLYKLHRYLEKSRNTYFFRNTIKGILLYLILFITTGTLLLLSDLAFHFNPTLLLWIRSLYTLFLFSFLIYYIGIPIYFWFINKTKYSKTWVAKIIGQYDHRIDDKITNILELEKLNPNNILIQESIIQKFNNINIEKLNPFFSYKNLLKQLYLFIGALILSILISLLIQDSFQYSASRILPFVKYKNNLPYKIQPLQNKYKVKKGSNIKVSFSVIGAIKPEQLYIQYGNKNYLLRDSSGIYIHNFTNVQEDIFFTLLNKEYKSTTYKIKCIPVPTIRDIKIQIIPPEYTNLNKKYIEGTGNFTFPYGSNITWKISTFDTDSLYFLIDSLTPSHRNTNIFQYKKTLLKDITYTLLPTNLYINKADSITFNAQMIPDLFPTLHLSTKNIELMGKFTFAGSIQDDYGFSSFSFIISSSDTLIKIPIPLIGKSLTQNFNYSGTLKDYQHIFANNNVEFYLELKDNDPFYPYKTVKSQSFYTSLPDKLKLQKLEQTKLSELKEKLNLGSEIMEQLNKEKQFIRKRLLSENLNNWEKQQLSQQIETNTNEIKKLSEQINKLREDLKKFESNEKTHELAEKKQLLEQLLEQLMNDELLKLMEELKKLKEEILNKNKNPNIDKIDISMNDLEKELDRNIEMLKRYEVEKLNYEVIEELKNVSKKFEEAKDTAKSNENLDSLKNKLNKTLTKHNKTIEKNKNLKSPYNLKEFSKEKQNISEQSNSLKNQQDLQNNSKNPSQKIKDLADQMQMNMEIAMQEQQGEDATMIRELLENLLQFSFIQEDFINKFNNKEKYNFNELKRSQIHLKERIVTIEDSLQALMERNFKVASAIGDQLENIHTHFNLIDKEYEKERFGTIQINQQIIMESVNELILLLSESLNQMNNSTSKMGGSCKKKGKKSKASMGDIKKQQQSFKKSLEQMINQLKQGKTPGKGTNNSGKELTKMLSQQEKMQKLLQEMMQSDEVGKTTKQILKEINKMVDKNINDIIKQNINNNTLNRQQRILNRMLKAEKAETKREKDKKRQAEKPNNYKNSNPKENLEYKEEYTKQKGIIKRQNIQLKYFFQRKYDNYVNKVENN